jgi:hypothetical protein
MAKGLVAACVLALAVTVRRAPRRPARARARAALPKRAQLQNGGAGGGRRAGGAGGTFGVGRARRGAWDSAPRAHWVWHTRAARRRCRTRRMRRARRAARVRPACSRP